jgi:hypothetical protein
MLVCKFLRSFDQSEGVLGVLVSRIWEEVGAKFGGASIVKFGL